MTATPNDEAVPVRPFADFLRELARGATHEEMSEALQTLVGAVVDTGKAGTLQLTVRVEPMKGDRKAVSVSEQIKIRLPEHDRDASLFFADDNHNLRRDDPNQLKFPSLAEVPAPPAGVDPTTGEITDTGKANA